MEETRCLEPDYAADFFCDGARCGAMCCQRWSVFVDEGTYQKYQRLPARERNWLLPRIANGLAEAEDGTGLPVGAVTHCLDFAPDKRCHFLREDKLCGVQRRLGEEYLGDTCALYPRLIMQIGGHLERALYLSCPLAAELALLRDEPLHFTWRPSPAARHQDGWVKTATDEGSEGMAEAFWLLQQTGLILLQQTEFPFTERLARLYAYLSRADAAVENGDLEALLKLSLAFREKAAHGVPPLPRHEPEWLAGLQEALAQAEADNERVTAIPRLETSRPLPPWPLLMENFLTAQFQLGLYPCCLKGSLAHNAAVFLALADLLEATVRPAWESGDVGATLSACVRLSILANHDRNWLHSLSACLEKRGCCM